jgi:hypothetical protein
MAVNQCVIGLPKKEIFSERLTCWACPSGKFVRSTYPSSLHKSTRPLQLLHTDICGPMQVPSAGGKCYFVTVLDEGTNRSSRTCLVFFCASSVRVAYLFPKMPKGKNNIDKGSTTSGSGKKCTDHLAEPGQAFNPMWGPRDARKTEGRAQIRRTQQDMKIFWVAFRVPFESYSEQFDHTTSHVEQELPQRLGDVHKFKQTARNADLLAFLWVPLES